MAEEVRLASKESVDRYSSSGSVGEGSSGLEESAWIDSKTRPIRGGSEASCRKILRAVQTLCEMIFKAFFTTCVISRTGTDVIAA